MDKLKTIIMFRLGYKPRAVYAGTNTVFGNLISPIFLKQIINLTSSLTQMFLIFETILANFHQIHGMINE